MNKKEEKTNTCCKYCMLFSHSIVFFFEPMLIFFFSNQQRIAIVPFIPLCLYACIKKNMLCLAKWGACFLSSFFFFLFFFPALGTDIVVDVVTSNLSSAIKAGPDRGPYLKHILQSS